ncbi:MAG TPA: cation-efflux pump [Lachnospiraceae bacterium]|nr:cation-efflux pump [Lachnospiraceae bacterium]
MISLLSRFFIKEADQYDKPEVRRFYGVFCSAFGIVLNIILFGIKVFAGVITGSVAITADAFNNLSDAASSVITLAGFKFAGMKPDKEHPFGHGRFEYISGLIVAISIILMGFELARSSVEKIFHPEAVTAETAATVILIISVLTKLYMAAYNYRIGKKINSSAMRATGMDSLSDAAATSVVLIAMGFMEITGINIDGYCGMLVALFILWAGYQAAKETVSPLLGGRPDEEFIKQVRDIVLSHDKIVGIHDMIVHDYGPGRVMISLHAEVPGEEDIFKLHEIIDHIEMELERKLQCNCVIHMDPIESRNEVVNAMRQGVAKIVRSIDEELTIHDFRMVTGESRTNLIFDVVLPQEFNMTEEEIRQEVQERVLEKYPNHYSVIKIEKAYV